MNGTSCCLIRACCPEPAQREALAKEIGDAFGWGAAADEKSTGNAAAVANWLLDHFDLVPKGVGAAIAEGYAPFFKERFTKEAP